MSKEKINRLIKIIKSINNQHAPLFKSFKRIMNCSKQHEGIAIYVCETDWLLNPGNYLKNSEYIERCLHLNDMYFKPILAHKYNLFIRLKELMNRPALNMADVSVDEIQDFLEKYSPIVGKTIHYVEWDFMYIHLLIIQHTILLMMMCVF